LNLLIKVIKESDVGGYHKAQPLIIFKAYHFVKGSKGREKKRDGIS
jgi:hypothetical protein